MELFKNILIKILEERQIVIADAEKLVEKRCYQALEEIIKIVRTPEHNDPECFLRIEKIVEELEKLGVDIGCRHEFG